MSLQDLAQAIQDWPLAQSIAASSWAFPTFESIHVIAITTVVGSVAVMDLRLLGWASTGAPVTEISEDTLRWTWGAFAVAIVTGLLMFISKAANYAANPYFLSKLALIALAGANMALFHRFTWRGVAGWDRGVAVPDAGRLAGGVSLLLWIVVVFLARAVGFTLDKYGPS
jgi:hypothetical protein